MSISVTFPFAIATGSIGHFESSGGIVDAITSNVRALLLTNWGERLMHFDLGCNFREFLFEPQTSSLKLAVAGRVQSQLAKWMPFLTLQGLFVTLSSEDTSIPDPGFRVRLEIVYGNVPINLVVNFPAL